jgi:hypothetical protein
MKSLMLVTLIVIAACGTQRHGSEELPPPAAPRGDSTPPEATPPEATAPRVDTIPEESVAAPRPAPPGGTTLITLRSPVEGRSIRFRLSAPDHHPIFLDNCDGAFHWGLEKRSQEGWEPAWLAVINECHSPPIEITTGSSRELTGVIRLQPGERIERDTYRLFIYGLYTAHNREIHHRNPEVPKEQRVSEPFPFGPLSPP